MELRFLATVFSLLLIFLPSICTGQNDNAEGSTSLSLRDAIRDVGNEIGRGSNHLGIDLR